MTAKFSVLLLPNSKEVFSFAEFKLGEGETVMWTVADYTRNSTRGLILVNARWTKKVLRRFHAHAWVVIIEDEGAGVVVVSYPAHADIAGAQVTVGSIIGQRSFLVLKRFAAPGAILPVCCYDYPLLAQRMPTFFPVHSR
jgi:hypothetical protein